MSSTRFFELIGIRGFYRMMSRMAGEAMLPPSTSSDLSRWDEERIEEVRDGARYFRTANFFRAIMYIFPFFAVLKELQETNLAWITIGTIVFVVCFHALCITLETYKMLLSNLHESKLPPDDTRDLLEPDMAPDIRRSPKMHWYFSPKFYETENFYRAIGMPTFKNWVTNYIEATKFDREQKKLGKKNVFVKGRSVDDAKTFIRDTRVAETIHIAAFFINFPLILEGIILRRYTVVWFVLPVVLLDAYLILLQRYHRLRIWPLLEKLEGKA